MNDIAYLDADKSQNVVYCIPLWVRDEQIKLAMQRIKARIEPHYELRSEPCAVVCYGPSLADTWEEVRNFKYIFSCSGAHKYLIERGIIPTWHVEVDPRAHKALLIGTPHKDVEYLIASCCHKNVFDLLEGYNSKLWHVFSNEDESLRVLPANEWALTGGSSVGLRTMAIARFFGFTDLHVFGMDGCEGKTGKHAAEHPNQAQKYQLTVYDGVEYRTTSAFLECARQTWHELDQMPDVKATFHGEGLVQAMAKHYKPDHKPTNPNILGFVKPETISVEYARLNEQMHKDHVEYGVGGGRYADLVLNLMKTIPSIQSVLDYGCGKGYLAKALPFPIWEYDPAIEGKRESPRPADLVMCIDVLEHIEPEKLNFVLADLKRCIKKVGFFLIDTMPANKHLPDGRNTHLIQKNTEWWEKRLSQFFSIGKIFKPNERQIHVMVGPSQKAFSWDMMRAA